MVCLQYLVGYVLFNNASSVIYLLHSSYLYLSQCYDFTSNLDE